ncbi:MAG: glycosyltransferase [Clostridia bacterium]|jgi:hypothetical protein
MNILFLGPYRDGTGYGNQCLSQMKALIDAGANLIARPIKMTPTSVQISEEIAACEHKTVECGVDAIIQHNLPSTFVKTEKALCIGSFAYETTTLVHTGWRQQISMMDMIFTMCEADTKVIKAETDAEVYTIGGVIDTHKFDNIGGVIDFGLPIDCHKFYTISELTERKNISDLVLAYLNSFTSNDNVALILKLNITGADEHTTKDAAVKMVDSIKQNMRRFENDKLYPPIIIITNRLSEKQLADLHNNCTTYVATSHGESWCMPAVDAICAGNKVVAPRLGGFVDYVGPECGYLLNTYLGPAYGERRTVPRLYTSNDHWYNIDVLQLQEVLRKIYDHKERLCDPYYDQHLTRFSSKNVGLRMLGHIERKLNAVAS